jgi:hypothetical protein
VTSVVSRFELAGLLFVLKTQPAGVAGAHGLAQCQLCRVVPDAPPTTLTAGPRAAGFGRC